MRFSRVQMSVVTHRPCEAELEAHRVGEAVRVGLRHLEGVGAEDRSHCSAVRARRLGGNVGLVVLQTNPKEGFALAVLVRMSGASGAAVGIPTQPFFIQKLLQFQLKHSGTHNLQHKPVQGIKCEQPSHFGGTKPQVRQSRGT